MSTLWDSLNHLSLFSDEAFAACAMKPSMLPRACG